MNHVDTTKTTTHISLCAGYGGIDIGLKRAIPSLLTVAFSEIEAFACANLVSKMEAGLLDAAPIWSNLKTFPWEEFRGKVDILSGGYPCQPFSTAGKRLGTEDPRHLWPYIAKGIAIMQPRVCFFENVEGHISLGLRAVIEDLERLGYKTAWGIFSAAEVGAPHQRKRVFILAHRVGERGLLSHQWNESGQQLPVWDGEEGRAWPSRPGQPQFGWEPPRVVGGLEDSAGIGGGSEAGNPLHQGRTASEAGTESVPQDTGWSHGTAIPDNQPTGADGGWVANTDRLNGSASAEGRQHDSEAGHASDKQLANSGHNECGGRSALANLGAIHEGTQSESETNGSSGIDQTRVGPELQSCDGDSEKQLGSKWNSQLQVKQPRNTAELGNASSIGLCGGEQDKSGLKPEMSRQRPQCFESNRKTQPALGGDFDGPANGMDYAQLCVTNDNRNDELRLLGNGVVPATAEVAFKTLMNQLVKKP